MRDDRKSDTVTLRVNDEPLAEFIVEHLSIQVTRFEVLIRGTCRDTYEDKVLFDSVALERLGYQPDGSAIPSVRQSWWQRFWWALRQEKP